MGYRITHGSESLKGLYPVGAGILQGIDYLALSGLLKAAPHLWKPVRDPWPYINYVHIRAFARRIERNAPHLTPTAR